MSASTVSASGAMLNAIHDGNVTHPEDDALAESALGAVRRQIGKDGFGFGGEIPERIEACALAMWAARTTKRNPGKKGRAGC